MDTPKPSEDYSLKKDLETARQDIRVIKDCLVGNEFTKGKGLVSDHQDLRAKVDLIEGTFNKYKNIFLGLAAGSGVGAWTVIKTIADLIFKH